MVNITILKNSGAIRVSPPIAPYIITSTVSGSEIEVIMLQSP